MATTTAGRSMTPQYRPGAVGLIVFAGVLMILSGIFHIVQGLIALANEPFYIAGEDYVFQFNLTSWGWIHLIAGALVALAGFALFQGSVWARAVAVVLAVISIIASFLWLPYYPIWSLVVIAFDVFVIWAVTVHGRDITRMQDTQTTPER